MKRMSLKELVIFNVLESILLVLIQVFLISEVMKCGLNIYIYILMVINCCLIVKEIIDWIRIINILKFTISYEKTLKHYRKKTRLFLKRSCKEIYGKGWKEQYKGLKKLGNLGLTIIHFKLMEKERNKKELIKESK